MHTLFRHNTFVHTIFRHYILTYTHFRGNRALTFVAAVVLFLQLPVPLYWFVLHPGARAWRRHKRVAYITALVFAWASGALFIFLTRNYFYAPTGSLPRALAGGALIIVELWLFRRSARDLGYRRLVGDAELSGRGEIMDAGIYARIRNPRYAGSLLAIVGACLIAGTRWMWLTAAIWAGLMFTAILMEESEMRGRFGAAYADYCCRVPRFLPRLSPTRAQNLGSR